MKTACCPLPEIRGGETHLVIFREAASKFPLPRRHWCLRIRKTLLKNELQLLASRGCQAWIARKLGFAAGFRGPPSVNVPRMWRYHCTGERGQRTSSDRAKCASSPKPGSGLVAGCRWFCNNPGLAQVTLYGTLFQVLNGCIHKVRYPQNPQETCSAQTQVEVPVLSGWDDSASRLCGLQGRQDPQATH